MRASKYTSSESEWKGVVLNNPETIKILIKNRSKFDKGYIAKIEYTYNPTISNGVDGMDEIINCVYLDIDRLIKLSDLSKKQIELINYLFQGYDYQSISLKYGTSCSNISQRTDKICEELYDIYNLSYENFLMRMGIKNDRNRLL